MTTLTPKEYQHIMAEFGATHRRSNFYVPMGMGKTYGGAKSLVIADMVEDVFPALICAPLRVARSTWPEEIQKWPDLRGLRVSAICGTSKKATVRERLEALNAKADIYTINYENLPWLHDMLGDNWFFKSIIADECTRLNGFRVRRGGSRAMALAKHAHKHSSRYTGLSGTPALRGLIGIWGQQWYVDGGVALGRSFTAFRTKFFDEIRMGADPNAVAHVPKPGAQAEIERLISPTTLTLDLRDWFDVQDPVVTDRTFDLPVQARKVYDDMEDELYAEINQIGIESVNAAVRSNKLLQITGGAVYGEDGKTWHAVHDVKLDILDEIYEEAAGAPILVAYNYRHELERILKAFPEARHLDADPKTERDWNAGKIPMLVAHPASAGHGLSLQHGGNILVYYGHGWDAELRAQILERIGPVRQMQSGYNRLVFVYNIVARNTIDEAVVSRTDVKISVDQSLRAALKSRQEARYGRKAAL